MNAAPPQAGVLNKKLHSVRVTIGAAVRKVYFAQAVIDPGKGAISHCRITRQDGTVVELKWDGKTACDDKNTKTEVGFESKDGKAKIFLTTWNNDNEWYPVKEIEWILDDESASVLIFGVTAK